MFRFKFPLLLLLVLTGAFLRHEAAYAQSAPDLMVSDLIVTQAVYGEPLVLGKQTVARVVTASADRKLYRGEIIVTFGDQTFSHQVQVGGTKTFTNVGVGAPSELKTLTVTAEVKPAPGSADPDLSNNTKTVTLPVVQSAKHIILYFLPVDWTPAQRTRYDFENAFPPFVKEQTDFFRGIYPLPESQIDSAYTPVPHMLAAYEKQIADSSGNEVGVGFDLMFGSASLAARRLRPDATLVVAVLPPGWFVQAGYPGPLGLSSRQIKGTVLSLFSPTDSITSAHEAGHIFDQHDDYDFSLNPPRNGIPIDRTGFWVERGQTFDPKAGRTINTFMSAAGLIQWTDTRIYEYLMARYVIDAQGGASEPLILAATMTDKIAAQGDESPGLVSAGLVRFPSEEPILVSVGAAAMQGGESIQARWFRGDTVVHEEETQARAGNAWYAFGIQNEKGLTTGKYRVEISLNGTLVKTDAFEVYR